MCSHIHVVVKWLVGTFKSLAVGGILCLSTPTHISSNNMHEFIRIQSKLEEFLDYVLWADVLLFSVSYTHCVVR